MPARVKSVVFLLACAGALAIGFIAGSLGDLRAAMFLEIAYLVGALPGTLIVLTWKGGPDGASNPGSGTDTDAS